MLLIWNLLFLLLIFSILEYHRIGLKISSLIILTALVLCALFDFHHLHAEGHFAVLNYLRELIFLAFIAALVFIINVSDLRSRWISRKIFEKYQKIMPKISSTERQALEAGTANWAKELFNGKPNWKILRSVPFPELSPEEKAFLEGSVEELCTKINDWQITQVDFDMPKEVWQFIREKGFFGLIIPKQYGGKAFSAYAHAQVVSKLYGVSSTVGTTVSVPNSLGPAELLLHYGTPDQKNYYLPRLAKGEEVPCFALTAPEAGSDAASITDSGVICKGIFNQQEIIGIRLNWNKRYITLAPCATVMGLAFKLTDPEKLVSEKTEYGITCALIPVNLPGITIGRRHLPMASAFFNGPIQGKDVFVPLDMIIGGMAMAGQGWRMLLECLSAGRAISLPSTAIGGSKMAVFATGAYAHIRKQFHLPIGKFEGISERLSRMAGQLYLMQAASEFTLSLIDQGDRPAILSGIMKCHITEMGRHIACDAMDVHGGKAICQGPSNYLGKFYQTMPIAITVEGANILTRSLIIFGQGSLRCHDYFFKEFMAAENNDLHTFDKAIWGHLGLLASNKIRTVFLSLTNGIFVKNPSPLAHLKKYYQQLTRFSSAYALLADLTVILLGSNLKRREKLSGRLGDILSDLFFISTVLKKSESGSEVLEEKYFTQWVCEQYFYDIQEKISGVLQNYPNKMIAFMLNFLIFPYGKRTKPPKDTLSQKLAESILNPGKMRDLLSEGMYKGGLMADLNEALQKVCEAESADKESPLQKEAQRLREKIIRVDDFSTEELRAKTSDSNCHSGSR